MRVFICAAIWGAGRAVQHAQLAARSHAEDTAARAVHIMDVDLVRQQLVEGVQVVDADLARQPLPEDVFKELHQLVDGALGAQLKDVTDSMQQVVDLAASNATSIYEVLASVSDNPAFLAAVREGENVARNSGPYRFLNQTWSGLNSLIFGSTVGVQKGGWVTGQAGVGFTCAVCLREECKWKSKFCLTQYIGVGARTLDMDDIRLVNKVRLGVKKRPNSQLRERNRAAATYEKDKDKLWTELAGIGTEFNRKKDINKELFVGVADIRQLDGLTVTAGLGGHGTGYGGGVGASFPVAGYDPAWLDTRFFSAWSWHPVSIQMSMGTVSERSGGLDVQGKGDHSFCFDITEGQSLDH